MVKKEEKVKKEKKKKKVYKKIYCMKSIGSIIFFIISSWVSIFDFDSDYEKEDSEVGVFIVEVELVNFSEKDIEN